jgi:3-oxoacyl-[acyl-carrier protein] reductase
MASNSEFLKGKTAIITGSNRGIGKAILEAFAANGADIIACTRIERKEFLALCKRLSARHSVRITPIYFDATSINEIKSAAKQIAALKIPIDVLVNNIGIGYSALFQMSTPEKLKEVFDVNFIAPFLFTQYIVKLMVRHRSGSIVNIASTAGIDGDCGRSVYGSSKAALINLTRSMAAELGGFGIRANAIAPGLTDTDMVSGMPENIVGGILQKSDLKRIGMPSEVADAAVFLASDMSSYMTGQVIRVDGGLK